MSSYQPFPIANFRHGLELGVKPWLAPMEAFQTMKNAFIKDGMLQKTKGARIFCTQPGIVPGTDVICMIHAHKAQSSGTETLLVANQDKLFKHNGTATLSQVSHTVLTTGAIWTGTWQTGKLSAVTWDGVTYMTNGIAYGAGTRGVDVAATVDGIQAYGGTTVAAVTPTIVTGVTIQSAKLLAVQKERLLCFRTQEAGTLYPQRVRWCSPGNASDWTRDEFIDAPTSEWIQGVGRIGDNLVVWFDKSVWWLRYTGDSVLPFQFERISDREGCAAPFSVVNLGNRCIALGQKALIECNGSDVYRLDQRVPDLALDMEIGNIADCFGILVEQERQIWLLHTVLGETYPDRWLCHSIDDRAWFYHYAQKNFNVAGQWAQQADVTWETAAGTWSGYVEPWISGHLQAGYPMVLAGGWSGVVYQVNYGTDSANDDPMPSDVADFEALSSRWNPFGPQGMKARLGHVDFLVTSNSVVSLTVSFYTDFDTAAHTTQTLSFSGDGERSWIRVYCGAVGNSHRIKLTLTNTETALEIHAIVPYFKPAGRITA